MKRQRFIVSISRLLIVSSCLIMVLFFGINFFLTRESYEKTLEEEVRVKQEQMLFYVSDTLEQSMEAIELLARSAANNYYIINNVVNYRKNQNSYEQMVFQNNMNQNLSSLAYSLEDIVSVNILMDDRDLRTTKPNGVYSYGRYMNSEIPEEIREMSSGWIPTRENDLIIPTYTPYIASYVLRIYSGLYYGDALGHLVINVDEDFFYDLIRKYSYDGTKLFLLDQEGMIISSSERGALGVNIRDTDYRAYEWDLKDEQQLKELKEQAMEEGQILGAKRLAGGGMQILALSDYNQALAPFRETQRLVMVSSAGLLLLFVFFHACLAYGISRPILRLSKEVTRFKEDSLTGRLDCSSHIYEINVLCREYNHMLDRIEELIDRLLKQEKLKQKKELEILQAQINPHFLYNTLESINWMALSMKQREISKMVVLLGNFLRLSLNKGNNIYMVRDEISHLKSYIEIQNIRCRGKIDFSLDIAPEILDYRMIKLLLQPLVENSILHGFDCRGGAGQIWVKGYEDGDYIFFTVADDGCGMEEDKIEAICDMNSETGHGLKNVMKRIALYYGEGSSLSIRSVLNVGTEIELCICREIPSV